MTQQERDALEPCPFCGGEGVEREFYKEGSNSRWHRIECDACDAVGPTTQGCSLNYMGADRIREVAAEAITAWNTRADVRPEKETNMTQTLGRFGHHPEAPIDFCIEVEEIEAIAESARLGLTGNGHDEDRAGLDGRIAKAMTFRVGGDEGSIIAKNKLREIEAARKGASPGADGRHAPKDEPWAWGWYDAGGKKYSYPYLPTVNHPRLGEGDGPMFPLYAHPPRDAEVDADKL